MVLLKLADIREATWNIILMLREIANRYEIMYAIVKLG